MSTAGLRPRTFEHLEGESSTARPRPVVSQSGMVARWRRTRDTGWKGRSAANAAGAVVTGTVLLVVLTTQFLEGAWMVALTIPVVILGMRSMHRHYERVEEALSVPRPLAHATPHRAVVLLEQIDAAA